jgi:hypothetical protein
MIRAGSSSLNDLVMGEFVLFNSYITCGLVPPISSFLLLLEEFSLQLQHLTPHSVLLVAVFVHFMEMFVGVHPCIVIFKHFYALVGIGRSKHEIGAYYFQLWHGMSGSYISTFSSAKWEDWHDDWVIATTDANDHLELSTKGPFLDRSCWKAKPSLPVELDPVLVRVKTLARGGLTSMMVLGDFLRCRIAPLQQRSRMACMFTGVNDCCRVVRGVGTDLSSAELETSIRVMTGEAYTPESLVLLRGIKAYVRTRQCRRQAWGRCRLSTRVAWRSGRWEATPIVGFGSPAPRLTASSAPTKAPAGPAMVVRPPPGRGRRRSLSQSGRAVRSTPSRPTRMTRCGERPPPEAARSTRRPGHGGSTAATDPSWGSRPPSARKQRGQGAEQLLGSILTAAMPAATGEARGGEAVSIAASTTTIAAYTAMPGIAATTAIPARAVVLPPPSGMPSARRPHQSSGASSSGRKDTPITRAEWVMDGFT